MGEYHGGIMTDSSDKREAALAFLKSQSLGVLATATLAAQPRARALYYAASDDFSLHFLTYANTRKAADLAENARAAFVVSDPEKPSTLQMEGTVTDESASATLGADMERLIDTLRAKGDRFAPLTRLDPATIKYYKFTPSWIRYGDFTVDERTAEVMTDITS